MRPTGPPKNTGTFSQGVQRRFLFTTSLTLFSSFEAADSNQLSSPIGRGSPDPNLTSTGTAVNLGQAYSMLGCATEQLNQRKVLSSLGRRARFYL